MGGIGIKNYGLKSSCRIRVWYFGGTFVIKFCLQGMDIYDTIYF